VDGLEVLALPRGESPPGWAPEAEQLEAVLASSARSHDLTVVDLPRGLIEKYWSAMRRADLWVVVVRADVRGVAAARELLRSMDAVASGGWSGQPVGVVVRHGRVRVLGAETVADGLGLPLLGTMADDPALALGADRGEPPARAARSPLARLCRELLTEIARPDPIGVG
jgi:Flp pilus assembly CpaE family ATPase